MFSSARRLLGTASAGCAIGATLLLAPAALPAQASLIPLTSCTAGALSQPFAQWGDYAHYSLSPGGDFESSDPKGSAWTLGGGARIVGGSETYAATGKLGASSLSLPALASAESPPTCVDTAYPTIRFFVSGSGAAAVSIVYDGIPIPTGVVVTAGNWTPTPVLLTTAPLWGLLSGGSANVSLEITGLTGSPRVDDVFVDPWGRS